MNNIEEIKFLHGFYFGTCIYDAIRSFEDPSNHLGRFRSIVNFAKENGVELLGYPMSIYKKDQNEEAMELFIGYPIAHKVLVVGSEFTTMEVPESAALKTVYGGDYHALKRLHTQMNNEVILRQRVLRHYVIEEYIKYAPVEFDSGSWVTNVFYFIQQKTQDEDSSAEKRKSVILILEDEPILSNAISKFLIRYGFDVVVARDGNDAHTMISKRRFDFALLDLLVPGTDGFSVLKKIRETDKDIPVFILSNLEEQENKRKALELGADKYFTKSNTLLSEVAAEINHRFGLEGTHQVAPTSTVSFL